MHAARTRRRLTGSRQSRRRKGRRTVEEDDGKAAGGPSPWNRSSARTGKRIGGEGYGATEEKDGEADAGGRRQRRVEAAGGGGGGANLACLETLLRQVGCVLSADFFFRALSADFGHGVSGPGQMGQPGQARLIRGSCRAWPNTA